MEEQEQTIDLRNFFIVLKKHIAIILSATIACGIIGFVLSAFIIEKQYTSEALLYVENSANKNDDSAININDINAAQKLVNTCQILFTSDYMLKQLTNSLPQFGYSSDDFGKIITIESVNSTEVLKISVTTDSPENSTVIADKLVELSREEYVRVIKNGSIEVVSNASYPERHAFPNKTIFTAIGIILGLLGSYSVFLVIELLDTKVKPDDDLAKRYDIPVFAEIMDFLNESKSNYKYNYVGSHGNKRKTNKSSEENLDSNDYDIDEEAEF